VTQGAGGTSTLTRSGCGSTPATFAATGLPAGVSVTFNPQNTTGASSVATFTASAAAAVGTANVTVTMTSSAFTRTVAIALTVNPAQNFTVSASPASLTINPGASGTSTLTYARTGGFTAAISCGITGQPPGATGTFNPASTTGNSSVLTIALPAGTAPGSYTITITCTGGGLSRSVTLTVTVPGTSNFTIAASPAALSVARGASGTSTITITRTSFTAAVGLTASGLPTGVTASFAPASTTGNSSVLTLTVGAAAAAGTSTVTVTGTSGTLVRTAAVSLTVTVTTGGQRFRVDPTGRITKNGQIFPVRCGSWFGLEGRHEPSNDPGNPSGAPMEQYIGNTFWANGGQGTGRTIQQTMTEISQMGINVIRLPLVPQTLSTNDPQGTGSVLKNHPSVRVANSRLALEQIIVAADQAGIEVMLDVHSCSNYVGWRKGRLDARPPYVDADRDNYDFTRETFSCSATNNPPSVTTIHPYNTAAWLNTLRTLAGLEQQLGVDNIIGIDIFNEPWDYTWQEWKSLTEQAYQAINTVNSNLLLFVQGISASAGTAGNQDGTPTTITQVPHGDPDTNPNWGENLFEAGANPINIPKSQLVFSPHTYGPSVFVQKMFMDPTQPECVGLEGDEAGDNDCRIVINPTLLRAGWEEHFGYLRDQGFAVVVGEFGGNLDWPLGQASQRDRDRWSHITPGVDGQWQNAFVDYMVQNNIEGCYWSINPESGDTAGWYGHFYDPVTNPAGWGQWRDFDERKTTLLRRLWGVN
jgi:aryl-phospho-beta-D-glucosidase BglC (GH1 family)